MQDLERQYYAKNEKMVFSYEMSIFNIARELWITRIWTYEKEKLQLHDTEQSL